MTRIQYATEVSRDENERGGRGDRQTVLSWCSVPCDYIPRKIYAVFQAREVVELLAGGDRLSLGRKDPSA